MPTNWVYVLACARDGCVSTYYVGHTNHMQARYGEHVEAPSTHVTTLEEPEGQAILRQFDVRLRQVAVVPTGRLAHKYPALQQALTLPTLGSEAMAATVETIAYWQDHESEHVRRWGTWQRKRLG